MPQIMSLSWKDLTFNSNLFEFAGASSAEYCCSVEGLTSPLCLDNSHLVGRKLTDASYIHKKACLPLDMRTFLPTFPGFALLFKHNIVPQQATHTTHTLTTSEILQMVEKIF